LRRRSPKKKKLFVYRRTRDITFDLNLEGQNKLRLVFRSVPYFLSLLQRGSRGALRKEYGKRALLRNHLFTYPGGWRLKKGGEKKWLGRLGVLWGKEKREDETRGSRPFPELLSWQAAARGNLKRK